MLVLKDLARGSVAGIRIAEEKPAIEALKAATLESSA
jgi:hypothetical protein